MAARAVADARSQPERLHLAYLDCYPLPRGAKRRCIAAIAGNTASRVAARSRAYTTAFGYEAERLGFRAFLRDLDKPCAAINDGPLYNVKKNAYHVECVDGHRYDMRYDESGWTLVR
ncbi:MAG: hypothetical protein KDA32_06865 [Phycisphaerales bacterium]|nr:hypothetical protein [Phycisphaerales bacterium]